MIGIIADDLTGAMDAASPFAGRGLRSMLYPFAHSLPVVPPADVPVIAINVDCRHVPDAEAGARIRAARAWLGGERRLFLKIDSTLRGPIPAMICAAAEPGQPIVIAPAVPSQGRTVRSGEVLVDGQPLAESAIAVDPRAKPGESCLLARLTSLNAAMPNADTDTDLDTIVRRTPPKALLVGAAGLATAYARSLQSDEASPPLSFPSGVETLVVIGSSHPASRAQLKGLRGRRPEVAVLASREQRDDPSMALDGLLRDAAAAIDRTRPRVIIATGGETAAGLLEKIAIEHLEVAPPPLDGLCAAVFQHGDQCIWLVTKAGGFGNTELLANVCAKYGLISSMRSADS